MVRTAIVLAGGFGTRLQHVVKELPKPMADINGKPFLQYVLDYLARQNINKIILSVGYKWERIREYFGEKYLSASLSYVVEESPLGTGGAILKAVKNSSDQEFVVLNGDTFFAININHFYQFHQANNSVLSLALKPMSNFDRYGVVLTDENGLIGSFQEKKKYETGDINGGIYLLNSGVFNGLNLPERFSFETDLMEHYYKTIHFYGFVFNDYFIDIGIPEDYARAQKELEQFTY